MTDAERERLIEAYCVVVTLDGDSECRRNAFIRMKELIAQRSPARVEQMERDRGLRA